MKRVYRCLRCDGPMSWKERCEMCGCRRASIGTLHPLRGVKGVPLKELPYLEGWMSFLEYLNSLDRWREAQRWLPAWLDNANWKTWIWHSAITIFFGHVLGYLPFISLALGLKIIVALYFIRETYNIFGGGNRKYFDAFMDVFCPMVASILWLRYAPW